MRNILALLAVLLLPQFALGADSVTQGKLIVQLAIPTTKDPRAQFVGLRPEALQMGLGEAVLIGNTDYQVQSDGSTRVNTRWHSITMGSNVAVTQPLQAPLSSQFRSSDKQVPPNTQVNIRGDLDLLAEDFLKLKAKLGKDSPRDIQRQTNNNNTTTEAGRNANELAPSSGTSSGGNGYSNSPYSLNSANDKVKADLITTQWQDCQPRIDRTAGKVFAQARKLDVTESGRLMSTGNCEDRGSTAAIARTYDGDCKPVIDVENRKVYHQYIENAKLDGKTVDVAACTADFTKFDAVKATNENCGYRHDFTAGRSVLQERLFYNDLDGKVIEVRSCNDSTQAFAQFTTQNTCTPTVDAVNKQVFINQRVAFTDGNGAEQYATDCKPDGNPAIAISEAFCDPKYEHDFVNHVSYYRTRAYYVDQKGNTVYVSQCGRSAADSFPHTFETGSCGVRNDDPLMMTYWKKLTQITTPTDGVVQIADCQEIGSPTPYAFLGTVIGAESVVASNKFFNPTTIRAQTAGVDWTNNQNTWRVAEAPECSPLTTSAFVWNGTPSLDTAVRVCDNLNVAVCVSQGGSSSRYGTYFGDRTYLTIRSNKYMRGDSTSFLKEYARNYRFSPGCTVGGTWYWGQ